MFYSLIVDEDELMACMTLHAEIVYHRTNEATFAGNARPEETRYWELAKTFDEKTVKKLCEWLNSNNVKQLTISFCEITGYYEERRSEIEAAFTSLLEHCKEDKLFLVYIDVSKDLLARDLMSLNSCSGITSSRLDMPVTDNPCEDHPVKEEGIYFASAAESAKDMEVRFRKAVEEHRELVRSYIEKCIIDATIPVSRKNESSPAISLSKYIDAKKMLEDKKAAFFLTYLLVQKILSLKIGSNSNYRKTKLMYYTLNGCAIATLISNMTSLDLLCIDHLGPIYRHYRIHKNNIRNEQYLLIADVICAGNEVSRAKCTIEAFGGSVLGYGCIADVGIYNSENETHPIISIYNVFENENKIAYTIETKFCERCRLENERGSK